MITRGGYGGISLDRLLTRMVAGEVLTGTTYRYTDRVSSIGDINGQGQYFPDGDTWYLRFVDSDGDSLPAGGSLTVGDAVTIMGAEGYNHTTTLTVYNVALNPCAHRPTTSRRHKNDASRGSTDPACCA